MLGILDVCSRRRRERKQMRSSALRSGFSSEHGKINPPVSFVFLFPTNVFAAPNTPQSSKSVKLTNCWCSWVLGAVLGSCPRLSNRARGGSRSRWKCKPSTARAVVCFRESPARAFFVDVHARVHAVLSLYRMRCTTTEMWRISATEVVFCSASRACSKRCYIIYLNLREHAQPCHANDTLGYTVPPAVLHCYC